MSCVIVPENQSPVFPLIVVGVIELLDSIPNVDILGEVKLRLVDENQPPLDDTDLLSSIVRNELRANNKVRSGVFINDVGEAGYVITQRQTRFP